MSLFAGGHGFSPPLTRFPIWQLGGFPWDTTCRAGAQEHQLDSRFSVVYVPLLRTCRVPLPWTQISIVGYHVEMHPYLKMQFSMRPWRKA
jgi:hypothetical protein